MASAVLEAAASSEYAKLAPSPERDVADAVLSHLACRGLYRVMSEAGHFGLLLNLYFHFGRHVLLGGSYERLHHRPEI